MEGWLINQIFVHTLTNKMKGIYLSKNLKIKMKGNIIIFNILPVIYVMRTCTRLSSLKYIYYVFFCFYLLCRSSFLNLRVAEASIFSSIIDQSTVWSQIAAAFEFVTGCIFTANTFKLDKYNRFCNDKINYKHTWYIATQIARWFSD